MSGETHILVGAACAAPIAVAFSAANSNIDFITVAALGAIGGTVCDVDSKFSKAGKIAKLACLFLILFLIRDFMAIGISISSISIRTIGVIIFIILMIIGFKQPHRYLTHSFVFVGACSFAVYLMIGKSALWYLLGGISHLVIDSLNKKGETLLYPIKKKYKLGVCEASGVFNNILGSAALVVIIFTYLAS